MAKIEIIKADNSWTDQPLNVDTESDIVWTEEGRYAFTGFLGALCKQDENARYSIQVAAVMHIVRGLVFRARLTVGHGDQQLVSRMSLNGNAFLILCALQADDLGALLDPQISRVQITVGGVNAFLPIL